MKQEIPKPARDLLAKQTPPDPHPSPELLNGYVEQSLADNERNRVTNHLAACSECREVVFLASAAAEEELSQTLVAAAAAQQNFDPHSAPVAQMPTMSGGRVASEKALRPKWMWWKWAAPAIALVVVAAGLLIERERIMAIFRPASTETVAMKNESAAPPSAPSLPAPSSEPSSEVASNAAPAAPQVNPSQGTQQSYARERAQTARQEAMRQGALQAEMASNLEKPRANPSAESQAQMEARQAAPASVPPGQKSNTEAAATPPVSADAGQLATALGRASKQQSLLTSGFAATNQAGSTESKIVGATQRVMTNRAQWRVTSDGYLEHALGPDNWTRVLGDQAVFFHVVATVGSNIWAGGSAGALFRSSDGGQHWGKVALNSAGQPENGAVTAIHFDNVQQGSITTDSGVTLATSDGGQTWTKQ